MDGRGVWNTWHEGLRSPQNPTVKPEGFVATGVPRAMYFTHHGKPWLKPFIARRIVAKYAHTSAKCYLSHDKNTVSLVRCPAWSYFVMAVPGMRLHPPWVTTKRQLQRLFFGDNVIHDNNNYTMYIPHDTFHIWLTFIYTYVQVTSPQPHHIDGPHVTDGNPKIAGKWCIMFEFKFNHFNQRQ